MIDPDLKTELDQLNKNLTEINKKSGRPGIWRSFFNGMFGALGYIVGIALIVVVLGWVLQKTGLLKPFQEQLKNFSEIIGAAKKLISPDNSTSTTTPARTNEPASNGGEGTMILPNGQQVKFQMPAQQ